MTKRFSRQLQPTPTSNEHRDSAEVSGYSSPTIGSQLGLADYYYIAKSQLAGVAVFGKKSDGTPWTHPDGK